MIKASYRNRLTAVFVVLLLLLAGGLPAFAQDKPDLQKIFRELSTRKGKRPVIIIPGILGSELVNKRTGERAWFRLGRAKDDDIRLPIALDLSLAGDDLVPGDILRKLKIPILPDVEIYQALIDALEKYGGYKQGKWDDPSAGIEDRYFLFPYDWRKDNVETAGLLVRRIEKFKKDSGRDDLRFNVLAHSMGGLVVRYAAMYGDRDIPDGEPEAEWPGEEHFSKIFLFGTPNEGSADALQTILEGFGALKYINLPFVRDLTPVEVITMPSIFQLMPHEGTYRFYDENLEPLAVDLYDRRTWQKYGWSIYGESKLLEKFDAAEIGRMEAYLEIVLERSRNFHRALDLRNSRGTSIEFLMMGSDCVETLDGFVLYRDEKKDRWITLTAPDSFRKTTGERVRSGEVKNTIFSPGDGRVSRRSMLAETLVDRKANGALFPSLVPATYALFICEEHDKLTGNPVIQNNFLTALVNEASEPSGVEKDKQAVRPF